MTEEELNERLQAARVAHKLADGKFTLGSGRVLSHTHEPTRACFERGCALHYPTDPHQDWPTSWSWGVLWRTCPCGELHVDADDQRYRNLASQRLGLPAEVGCGCPCNCCGGNP